MPALVMLGSGLWGLDRGGMWRDEAVTFQVARRTVPQIWRLLHDVDAVHGLYYLLMHAVLPLHPGEVVLRLPSVCAAALTAGLVAELGARLIRPRAGLWAGLLYAVSPMAGHYAQEGRSYALVAAGATAATLLFVRAAREDGSWRMYGAVLGLTCWLHEFAVLLLLAHAASLALARAGVAVWRSWGCAAGAVVLALLPMALVSHAQSAQLAWLRPPTAATAQGLLRTFLGPTDGVYGTCLALAAVGLAGLVARRGGLTCAGVCLPLAVLPPAVLMLASQLSPLYVDRYVLYALSGAPLLVAAGADRVARVLARPRVRLPAPVVTASGAALVVFAAVHQFPLLSADRVPAHRPDDLAAVARAAAHPTAPGEAVLFLPATERNVALTYPGPFRGARDVALAVPGPASGTLYGRETGAAALRERMAGFDRVWVVADRNLLTGRRRTGSPVERAKLDLLARRFVPVRESVSGDMTVRLYVRGPRSAAAGAPGVRP
ncbi:glycosyltransferase family 39 protein [Streptomyces sp. NPDC005573]|uniref:glycosyltransferase family 39 protein n=1 Tax=Streptomyces sp. NPDC005573 TaxID=3156890 RepID=UPI00339E90D3